MPNKSLIKLKKFGKNELHPSQISGYATDLIGLLFASLNQPGCNELVLGVRPKFESAGISCQICYTVKLNFPVQNHNRPLTFVARHIPIQIKLAQYFFSGLG